MLLLAGYVLTRRQWQLSASAPASSPVDATRDGVDAKQAGVALAACVKERERLAGKTVAVVICGANISYEKLRRVL